MNAFTWAAPATFTSPNRHTARSRDNGCVSLAPAGPHNAHGREPMP